MNWRDYQGVWSMPQAELEGWLEAIKTAAMAQGPREMLHYHALLDTLRKDVKARDSLMNKTMEALGRAAADQTLTEDVRSAKLDTGSINAPATVVYSVKDWPAFYRWIAEDPITRVPQFMNKTLSTTRTAEHVKTTGETPPGVSATKLVKVKVNSKLLEEDSHD